jgi:hypothetical protein
MADAEQSPAPSKKIGRPPAPGGKADLAAQMLQLKQWTNLSDTEFSDRINAESKVTLGLLLQKIRESVPDMSPSQASISYGILSDKRLNQSLAPQPTNLHQMTVNIHGFSGTLDDLKEQLSGRKRREKPVAGTCIDLPVNGQESPTPKAKR